MKLIPADFLLQNDYGKKLFHNVASTLPIIDFHNHIDCAGLATNKQYENVYQLWVQNDPYKHRAMRICGIAEQLITGNATDEDKFMAWAKCLPLTVGNPLFNWSCMELQQVFGLEEILTPANANLLWQQANALLAKQEYATLQLIKKFNVEILCTSDDLLDDLASHSTLANQQQNLSCLPSLRSDSILAFNQPSFFSWLQKLQTITTETITDLGSYKQAVLKRLAFFNQAGCLLSDHSLDSGFTYLPTNETTAAELFKRVIEQKQLTADEIVYLQAHLLLFLGKAYANMGWKMQLHIGAYRYTSTRLRELAGAAGGFACIGNALNVKSLCTLLDELDRQQSLPPTILYTLNPADNAVLASLTGSYAQDGVRGKIQFGPAWWYNDHYEGIINQLTALSSYGLLATSIGMTTDSRSILSFTRHEYYRRILCNLIGEWIRDKKVPNDMDFVTQLVQNIAYYNIKNWLKK